jgi:hypothetical protein
MSFAAALALIGTMALLLICLLRRPLRWSGVVLAVVATNAGSRRADLE